MSKLTISEGADPNYLGSVVSIKSIRPHSNADKLMLTTVFGNQVIISKSNYEGQLMVYFPVESTISAEYLTWANMYSDSSKNADEKIKGYFSDKRRVKPTRLRGEISNGIVLSVDDIAKFFNIDVSNFVEGTNFDTVDGKAFVAKYVPRITKQGEPGEPGSKGPKEPGISQLLLPNQFKFHSKTTQLGMAVHSLKPTDTISVSSKLHGTSAVFSNVLCKTPIKKWKRWIAEFIGIRYVEQEYTFVYSSRSVIKNRRDGEYTGDVWGQWAEALEPKLPAGITLYGEIVGYTHGGRAIQKGYAYGCEPLTNQFYIYRITYTDALGKVMEYDWQLIRDFCEEYNLEVVPTYYYGKAGDLFDVDPELENWNELFLEALKETYLEKPDELCNTGIVREGVCLRKENSGHKNAWKLKSFSFLQAEAADRDNDVTNMEEEA